MENQTESRFSPKARRLFSRAFTLGVDPVEIVDAANRAKVLVGDSEDRVITRGDLVDLKATVNAAIAQRNMGGVRLEAVPTIG